MVTEYCRGCIYLGTFHAYEKCCDYILMTKRRRPCPSGDGCTAKKTREGTAVKERAWDTERAKTLLIGGSSYTSTADAVGCKVEELKSWMKCEQNRKAAWLEDYKPARGRGRAQKRALVSGSEAIVAGGETKSAYSAPESAAEGEPQPVSRPPEVEIWFTVCGCRIMAIAPSPPAAIQLLERLSAEEMDELETTT